MIQAVQRTPEDAPRSQHAIGAIFASGDERERLLDDQQAAGHALVSMPRLSPLVRGRLFEAIEDACDALITSLGGPPPGLGAFGTASQRIRDRLFRIHRVRRAGMTIVLGSLAPLAHGHGALAPEDGEALRALATVDGPVLVVLEESDARLGVFRAPIALADALRPKAPAVAKTAEQLTLAAAVAPPAPAALAPPEPEPAPPVVEKAPVPTQAKAPVERPAGVVTTSIFTDDGDEYVFLPVEKKEPESEARIVARPPTLAPRETPWRAHAQALAQARGPQPLSEFERLFTEHYVPLMTALEQGLDDARARATREEFRHTFARSYAEAFPTFLVTGKRPKLVLDAPDVASRIARLHGARTAQLLLVDGLRWDLGVALRDTLLIGLGPQALLADETFLMSALPSNTTRQLAGLARGFDGLRAQIVDATEGEALGGRTSEVVRRVRLGGRDLCKLDVVEARLRSCDDAPAIFHEIVRKAADAIVRHAATLPPRTLLFVFGDHGFSIDGAGKIQQGGASPEEVIVPAFAFLLGMVQ